MAIRLTRSAVAGVTVGAKRLNVRIRMPTGRGVSIGAPSSVETGPLERTAAMDASRARESVVAALQDLHRIRAKRGFRPQEAAVYERLCEAERVLYGLLEQDGNT